MFTSKQLISQLKLKPDCTFRLILKASICHISELPSKTVHHWPYESTSWNFARFLLDPFTKNKFTENSKIIQIEGNVACGKEDFGRRLADELGMKYLQPIDLESYYINDHGYDYRALNPLLPERLRICDWQMFHENPARHSVVHMQHILFKLRMFQWIKACQHVFNTGQGVILARSAFTERVFVEAMHNIGWLPLGYLRGDGVRFYDWKNRYNFIRNLALCDLMKPHLTIYLQTPVEICMERIKNSTNPMIANSAALVPEFLENIERSYRDVVLPKQAFNGHVLEYDYPEMKTKDEILDVVDDINRLDFEFDDHDTRFEDWNSKSTYLWHFFKRRELTNYTCLNPFKWLEQPWFDIAGLGDSVTLTDLKLRTVLFEGHVGPFGKMCQFNTDPGIKNPLSAFIDHMNFGGRLNQIIRSDYV